jgi:hypothetical protein
MSCNKEIKTIKNGAVSGGVVCSTLLQLNGRFVWRSAVF